MYDTTFTDDRFFHYLLADTNAQPGDANLFGTFDVKWTEQERAAFADKFNEKRIIGRYLEAQILAPQLLPKPFKFEFSRFQPNLPQRSLIEKLWDQGIQVQVRGRKSVVLWNKGEPMPLPE